jgi:hypothetical protein
MDNSIHFGVRSTRSGQHAPLVNSNGEASLSRYRDEQSKESTSPRKAERTINSWFDIKGLMHSFNKNVQEPAKTPTRKAEFDIYDPTDKKPVHPTETISISKSMEDLLTGTQS